MTFCLLLSRSCIVTPWLRRRLLGKRQRKATLWLSARGQDASFHALALPPDFVGGDRRPRRDGNRLGREPRRGAVPGRVPHRDLLGGAPLGPAPGSAVSLRKCRRDDADDD